MIIVIASEKGGTGKTTTATNLAILRAYDEKDILIVDADPQNSTMHFCSIREEERHIPAITSASIIGQNLGNELRKLSPKFDDIIVDVGGRDSASLRSSLLASDVLAIPFLPSQFDVWGVKRMDQLVGEVLQLNNNINAITFLNKVHTNPKIPLAEEASKLAQNCENLVYKNTPLRDRVAFTRAISNGIAVNEFRNNKKDLKAEQEIQQLFKEVFNA